MVGVCNLCFPGRGIGWGGRKACEHRSRVMCRGGARKWGGYIKRCLSRTRGADRVSKADLSLFTGLPWLSAEVQNTYPIFPTRPKPFTHPIMPVVQCTIPSPKISNMTKPEHCRRIAAHDRDKGCVGDLRQRTAVLLM
jgi:hypothetical protein